MLLLNILILLSIVTIMHIFLTVHNHAKKTQIATEFIKTKIVINIKFAVSLIR